MPKPLLLLLWQSSKHNLNSAAFQVSQCLSRNREGVLFDKEANQNDGEKTENVNVKDIMASTNGSALTNTGPFGALGLNNVLALSATLENRMTPYTIPPTRNIKTVYIPSYCQSKVSCVMALQVLICPATHKTILDILPG